MFTGIVAALGRVESVTETTTGRRISLDGGALTAGMYVGDSLAVNGVCLTALDCAGDRIAVEVVQESLDRSNLGELQPGDRVDLERPLEASGRFDGHIVQGHVDGVGTIDRIAAEGEARRIRVSLPEDLSRYVVEKGSIAIDGVSLTVTAVADAPAEWFEVVLIPHTLKVTVIGDREVGDRVNLEADVLAKYVERLMST